MTLEDLAIQIGFEVDEKSLEKAKENIEKSFNELNKNKDVLKFDTSKIFDAQKILNQIQHQLGAIGTGIIAAFSINSIYNFISSSMELSEELKKIEIRLESIAGLKSIDELNNKFVNLSRSTNMWFSEKEFKDAAFRFIQLGGNIDEFNTMIDSVSKKAIIMGVNLVDAVEGFQLAAIKGNVTQLMRHGFIDKETFDAFEKQSQQMDETQRRNFARMIAYQSALKISNNQLNAFNKILKSHDATFRKFGNNLDIIKKMFGDTLQIMIKPIELVAMLLDKIIETKLGKNLLKIGVIFTIITGSILSFLALIPLLSLAGKVIFSVFSGLGIAFSPILFIAALLTELILIVEDFYIMLKGGNSQFAIWGKSILDWAKNFPILMNIIDALTTALDPFFSLLETGIQTGNWIKAFEDFWNYIKESFSMWGQFIKGFWLDIINFIMEKIVAVKNTIKSGIFDLLKNVPGGEIILNAISPQKQENISPSIPNYQDQFSPNINVESPNTVSPSNKSVSFTIESINITLSNGANGKEIAENITGEIRRYFENQLADAALSFQSERLA